MRETGGHKDETDGPALWKPPDTPSSHHSTVGGACWEYRSSPRQVRESFPEEVMSRALKGGKTRGIPGPETGHSSRLVHHDTGARGSRGPIDGPPSPIELMVRVLGEAGEGFMPSWIQAGLGSLPSWPWKRMLSRPDPVDADSPFFLFCVCLNFFIILVTSREEHVSF